MRLRTIRFATAGSPALLPLLLAFAVFAWFAVNEAGFEPTTWYPGGVVLMALLAVALLSLPRPRPSRPALVAVVLITAYAFWSLLSIVWADDAGTAWEGANRTLPYAAAFALAALWPLSARAATLLIGGYAAFLVVLGLATLLRADAAVGASGWFLQGRLDEPAEYANANVALWFSGFWPCLVLATRRELSSPLRGFFLGGGALLCGLALLGQSRGWLFSLPFMLALLIAVAPARARVLAASATLGIAALAMYGPVAEVPNAWTRGAGFDAAVTEASRTIAIVALATGFVGLGAALADRHLVVGRRLGRVADAAAVATVAVAAVGTVAVYGAVSGSPIAKAADYWDAFKSGEGSSDGLSRLTGPPGTRRYDFWLVGWEQFRQRPLTGVGADNFQQRYLERGRSQEQPRYPHSLEVRVLSQTGLVGAALLLAALIAALLAGLQLRGRRDLIQAVAAAATLVVGYWIVHGSVDWLWEFPGLAAPAFTMLGIVTSLADGTRAEVSAAARPARRWPARAAIGVGVTACLTGATALTPAWLAELEIARAGAVWRRSPEAALEHLDRAASWNRLSDAPPLVEGTIAVRRGRLRRAEPAFQEALRRDPLDAYALLQLGAIASARGDRQAAVRLVRRSLALTPRYDITRDVLRDLERGRELNPGELSELIADTERSHLDDAATPRE